MTCPSMTFAVERDVTALNLQDTYESGHPNNHKCGDHRKYTVCCALSGEIDFEVMLFFISLVVPG